MTAFIGCELLPPRLNVLNFRAATAEDLTAHRCCSDCLRSSWPRQSYVHTIGSRAGHLRCTLQNRHVRPMQICDAFEPPPFPLTLESYENDEPSSP